MLFRTRLAVGGLECPETAAEHRLADVPVLKTLVNTCVMAVNGSIKSLLSTVVDAGDAKRGQLRPYSMGNLLAALRDQVVR